MFCKSCQKEIPNHLIHGLTCPVCAADLRITGREDVEPPPVSEPAPPPETTPAPRQVRGVIVRDPEPAPAVLPSRNVAPKRNGVLGNVALLFGLLTVFAVWLGGSAIVALACFVWEVSHYSVDAGDNYYREGSLRAVSEETVDASILGVVAIGVAIWTALCIGFACVVLLLRIAVKTSTPKNSRHFAVRQG